MGFSIALNVVDGVARHSLEYCIRDLSQRFKLDPNLLRCRFAETYETIHPANQPPFPGVCEVCELIHAHGGINVIVTHRGLQSTQLLLDMYRLAHLFTSIFSVGQGYTRKPDPVKAWAALEAHTLNPGETLLIGDRAIDIQMGRAAGVHTCSFRNSEPGSSTDIHIESYGQLLKRLKRNWPDDQG